MSTTIACIIPLDENYIPDKKSAGKIRKLFDNKNKYHLKVEIENNDDVLFYDCGQNFESINCPYCNKELDGDWWGNAMNNAFETNFNDLSIITPCCNKESSLNQLHYTFPQGFARFAVKIEDHELDKLPLDDKLLSELKKVSGQDWKVIYDRI